MIYFIAYLYIIYRDLENRQMRYFPVQTGRFTLTDKNSVISCHYMSFHYPIYMNISPQIFISLFLPSGNSYCIYRMLAKEDGNWRQTLAKPEPSHP